MRPLKIGSSSFIEESQSVREFDSSQRDRIARYDQNLHIQINLSFFRSEVPQSNLPQSANPMVTEARLFAKLHLKGKVNELERRSARIELAKKLRAVY